MRKILQSQTRFCLRVYNKYNNFQDTKLDVLNILANVANKYSYSEGERNGRNSASSKALQLVRNALQNVSEWFDEYIASEEQCDADESFEDEEPVRH